MAFTSKGLTLFGYDRPSLQEIYNDIAQDMKNTFGSDLLVTNDSVAGQIAAIIAERENRIWSLLEEVYYNTTAAGAEGIYLDDLYGKFGFTRLGKQSSTGTVYLETDSTCLNNTIISSALSYFNGDNNLQYYMSADQRIIDNVEGFYIKYSDVTIGTKIFYIIDNLGTMRTYTYTITEDPLNLGSPLEQDVLTFFISVINFIAGYTDADSTRATSFVDDTTKDCYIGFDPTTKQFVGIGTQRTMYFNQEIGNRYTAVNVEASQKGYNYIVEFVSMKSEPIGFVDLHTVDIPYAGADTETDAEYRYRFANATLSRGKATRDAIVSALYNVEGVERVRLYVNTTDEVGISPAPPKTMMCVVFGGGAVDIAQAIYDTKALGEQTSGDVTIDIATADDNIESISYQSAKTNDFQIGIQYRTKTTLPLSTTEQTAVKTKISEVFESYKIGDSIFNIQIASAVYQAVEVGRLTSLTVSMKRTSESIFSTKNIQLDFDEIGLIKAENITFSQQV